MMLKVSCDQNYLKVEDGREGGNQEFEDGISDQYEDEVNITEIILIDIVKVTNIIIIAIISLISPSLLSSSTGSSSPTT